MTQAFLLQVVLGLAEFGGFAVALALAQLAAVPATGLEKLAIRETANEGNSPSHKLTLLGISFSIAACSALVLIPLAVLFGVSTGTLVWMLPLVVLQPTLLTAQAILRSGDKFLLGQVPNELIRPAIMLVLTLLLFISPAHMRTSSVGVAIAVAGTLTGLAVATIGLVPELVGSHFTPEFIRPIVTSVRSFAGLAIATTLSDRLDLLLLSGLSSPQSVGLYALAQRTLPLLLLSQNTVVFVMAPRVARLAAGRHQSELRRINKKITLVSGLGCLAFGVPVFAAAYALNLTSSRYSTLPTIVGVFLAACLANSVVGGSSTILSMSGRVQWVSASWLLGSLAIVAGSIALVPRFNEVGAALSFLVGTAIAALTMALLLGRLFNNRKVKPQ